jgi:hypothetical protein
VEHTTFNGHHHLPNWKAIGHHVPRPGRRRRPASRRPGRPGR